MCQKYEGVALARRVTFSGKEGLHELWRVWNEMLKLAVDGEDGKDSVLAHVGMTMLQA